jgi:hypothetical protein
MCNRSVRPICDSIASAFPSTVPVPAGFAHAPKYAPDAGTGAGTAATTLSVTCAVVLPVALVP